MVHSVVSLIAVIAVQCRFGAWTYYAYQLDLVEHQSYSDIEQQSNYHYDENCSYQMISGVVQSKKEKYACCPDEWPELVITLQLVHKETTLGSQ